MTEREANFLQTVVIEIQVAAGAAPYATQDELIDIFSTMVDHLPEPQSPVDLLVLRRLFASATRRIYLHVGAQPPLRRVVNAVADADDPKSEFKAALARLRS